MGHRRRSPVRRRQQQADATREEEPPDEHARRRSRAPCSSPSARSGWTAGARRSSNPTCRSSTPTTTSGTDRAARALPARRAAGRPEQRPPHRRDRLPPVLRDAPRRRPRGAAPGRRDRVRQRRRRDERQRRATARPASAPASSATPTCGWASGCRRCWRRTCAPAAGGSAASATSRPGTPRCTPTTASRPVAARRARAARRSGLPRRLRAPGAARPLLRRLAAPPPAPRADGAGAGVPRHARSSSTTSARPLGHRRATPGGATAVFADWSASIRELATCPNVAVKLGGLGMTVIGFGFHEASRAAVLRAAGGRVAALRGDLHRGVRRRPLHVREQLPGRQGGLQLRRVLERLQAPGAGRERDGAGGAVQPHRRRGSTGSTCRRPRRRARPREAEQFAGAAPPAPGGSCMST